MIVIYKYNMFIEQAKDKALGCCIVPRDLILDYLETSFMHSSLAWLSLTKKLYRQA